MNVFCQQNYGRVKQLTKTSSECAACGGKGLAIFSAGPLGHIQSWNHHAGIQYYREQCLTTFTYLHSNCPFHLRVNQKITTHNPTSLAREEMVEINAPACAGMNTLEKVLTHRHKVGNYFQNRHVCMCTETTCCTNNVEDTIWIWSGSIQYPFLSFLYWTQVFHKYSPNF